MSPGDEVVIPVDWSTRPYELEEPPRVNFNPRVFRCMSRGIMSENLEVRTSRAGVEFVEYPGREIVRPFAYRTGVKRYHFDRGVMFENRVR